MKAHSHFFVFVDSRLYSSKSSCHYMSLTFSVYRNFRVFAVFSSFLGIFWSWKRSKKTAQERCLQVQSQLVWLCGSELDMDSLDSMGFFHWQSWGFSSRKAPSNYRQFVSKSTLVKDLRIKSLCFFLFNHR